MLVVVFIQSLAKIDSLCEVRLYCALYVYIGVEMCHIFCGYYLSAFLVVKINLFLLGYVICAQHRTISLFPEILKKISAISIYLWCK